MLFAPRAFIFKDQHERSVTGAAARRTGHGAALLGSLFEALQQAPERDAATLDALVGQIMLDEGPKTLLGLAVTARAEKWLRRRLWMVDFDSLSPSDRAVRAVIESAMRIGCA
jgi:hypothetical protein